MIRNTFNHLATTLNSQKCIVKWSSGEFTSRNIGDVLNVYLFKKIFGKDIVSYKEVLNLGVPPVYSFIGSVLDNSAVRNLTVMGSGFKRESSPLKVLPKNVISCRGPLTRKKLMQSGLQVPEIYGDPAILLPHFYNPGAEKKFKMGLIPHYVDKEVDLVKKWEKNLEVKIIDVFSGMEEFVTDIKSCEFTISSSLHGVILSHAYGVPSVWVKLSKDLVGGSFKFDDYYQSLGHTCKPIFLEEYKNLEQIESKTDLPEVSGLSKNLLSTFQAIKIS